MVGGGHGVEAGASGRPASVGYLGQIARSAEQLGFEAALTPTGAWCEDAWLSTAMLSTASGRGGLSWGLDGRGTRPVPVARGSGRVDA